MPSDEMETEDVLDRGEIEQAFHRADETTDADAWLERNIDPLLARIEALEAERERYREALEEIGERPAFADSMEPYNVKRLRKIARRALEDQ